MNRPPQKTIQQRSTPQSAMAAEIFNHFCAASSMRQILSLHRSICDQLTLKPTRLPDFYPKLKDKLSNSWKAQALFKKFDARANHKVYAKGQACPNTRVLIIGAGPCGLRAAIECQLMGAKVVVVEKRDRMSRNNVLHLWPFVIHDLRALGAKKFYGKFCAGAIDHISIRQLQCILLKVCLLLGVEFHEGVGFEELLEPSIEENGEVLGWRARVSPADHPVSHYEFDTLIGADGKRNTLRGFKRKDFRGKLAIAITANFINRNSEQEASVEEISGVAFIFKQKFFKDLYSETGIDLENIVYYKDETHYFVMTAKKHSLLEKGVLIKDNPETTLLLSKENVDRDALQRYAREAAHYSTEGQLPHMEFALNHYGEPDVTLFDFTSMYAAENASMVLERNGRRLLCTLVGDSLLEPFWPTGSGCARGFLSALDASWAVKAWGQSPPPHPLTVILERESIYRVLPQTTPENLNRDFGAYTLDPRTRYPNLNKAAVTLHRVASLYNSDDPLPLDAPASMRKRKREAQINEEALVGWVRKAIGATESAETLTLQWAVSAPVLAALLRRYRPDLLPNDADELTVYNVLMQEFYIQPMGSPRSASRGEVSDGRMRAYLRSVYRAFKGEVPHIQHNTDIVEMDRSENGNYQEERRPDSSRRYRKRKSRNSQEEGRAVGIGARSGSGATVARLAAELTRGSRTAIPLRANKPDDLLRSVGKIEPSDWNVRSIEKKMEENRLGRPAPRQAERVPKWDREKFVARQQRLASASGANEMEPLGELELAVKHIDQMRSDSGRPALGTNKVARLAEGFDKKPANEPSPTQLVSPGKPWTAAAAEVVATAGVACVVCGGRVFAAESAVADGLSVHRSCFRCRLCRVALRAGMFLVLGNRLTCLHHSHSTLADNNVRHEGVVPSESTAVMPERITLEASDAAVAEMDEEEWAGRNFLPSETSGAAGLSDESSSDEEYTEAASETLESHYDPVGAQAEEVAVEGLGLEIADGLLDDDMLYLTDSYEDDFSDETPGGSSSGGESSRLVAAREARRREVPPPGRVPSDSSEVESEDECSTTTSSATEVSTDSEFEEEEATPSKIPPSITVTAPTASIQRQTPAAPAYKALSPKPVVVKQFTRPIIEPSSTFRTAPPPPVRSYTEFPLSRTRSAGGIATKRALELKRRYLLGEPSPTAVRRSDSASRLDSQFENFTMNISQFQAMLNPAPNSTSQEKLKSYVVQSNRPNVLNFLESTQEISENTPTTEKNEEPLPTQEPKTPTLDIQLDTDSLSDSSESLTKTGPSPPVPRLEVHNASGELVQLDSLIIVDAPPENEKSELIEIITAPSKPESDSSESCRDPTTLALTETELSDWAGDGGVFDELGFEDKLDWDKHRTSARNPRVLSAPKNIHETKNIASLAAHVCGRNDVDTILFSNATEHFEFADEGDDVSITNIPIRNSGYMEFVDEDYTKTEDRSMDFIERASSCIECPSLETYIEFSPVQPRRKSPPLQEEHTPIKTSPDEPISPNLADSETPTITELSSTLNNGNFSLSKSSFTNLTEMSSSTACSEDTSPPLTLDTSRSVSFSTPLTLLVNSNVPYQHIPEESPPERPPEISSKAQEIKREREQQTEVVRRLVMERIGGSSVRKSRRARPVAAVAATAPPPVPAPPSIPPPPTRPPPPLRLVPSMSDPELTRVRRRRGIIQTVSDFFNRRVGIRKKSQSEPADLNNAWEEWGDCACVSPMRGGRNSQAPAEPRPPRRAASHGPLPPTHHRSQCCPPLHRPKTDAGVPAVNIWTSD